MPLTLGRFTDSEGSEYPLSGIIPLFMPEPGDDIQLAMLDGLDTRPDIVPALRAT